MKTLVVSTISLLVGAVIGWSLGRAQVKHRLAEAVELMVSGAESSDAAEAARDAQVIGFIESGDIPAAVQSLCTPIAHFYGRYEASTETNDRRSRVRALIEQLARTNPVVAARIAEVSTNSGRPLP